jgi:predicted site-specific integrase-resolvase
MDDTEHTLPATAVLQIHNVSRTELYRWVKTGKLNAVKRGQPLQWHFIPVEVERLRQERVQLLEVQRLQILESVWDYLERVG